MTGPVLTARIVWTCPKCGEVIRPAEVDAHIATHQPTEWPELSVECKQDQHSACAWPRCECTCHQSTVSGDDR